MDEFNDINTDLDDLDSFEPVAKIVIIGVGGAGNNAVNRMIDDNIQNVEFYVLNTDKQALASSKAPHRIILGKQTTGGLGAGGDPAVGRKAAEESEEEIRKAVAGAHVVFIAAGMGKGTGTGASPVVAKIAKESGALTIAIVTRPFNYEGSEATENAIQGLTNLKDVVDSIIVVSNDRLLTTYGNVPYDQAMQNADHVLAQSVKTVVDIILLPGGMNLDLNDVKATLQNSGTALIGYGVGTGENKADDATMNAINSPLLETKIHGAKRGICAITCGPDVSMYETQKCISKVRQETGGGINLKIGTTINQNLSDTIIVSVIAADFGGEKDFISAPDDSGVSIDPIPSFGSTPQTNEKDDSFGANINLSEVLKPNFGND